MPILPIPTAGVNASLGGRPFEQAASEPTLLLIHGAGMDRTAWQMQTRWLAFHGSRAIAIDLPGHGLSADQGRNTVQDYVAWLIPVIQEISAEPVHLAGHSLGSFIGLELAAQCPELVASLSMVGTAASMPVHPALLEAADGGDPLAGQLMAGWGFDKANAYGNQPAPGSSMISLTEALVDTSRPGVLGNDLRASSGYENAVTAAGAVRCPVQLILGASDKMTPVRGAQALIEAFASPEVTIVENCGHMLMIEAPRKVRQLLRDFADTATERDR